MCPIPYTDLMRQSKDKKYVRYAMVRYAQDDGVKPAARECATTPKTVRKWYRRWEAGSCIQTDNGSEFIGSWNARAASSFTRAVETIPGLTHTTIPPGAHTWQADVETVHRLIEDECYEVEPFPSRRVFLAKAASYTLWFNTVRRNSGKHDQAPWDIIHARDPTIRPAVVAFPPVFLDVLWKQQRKTTAGGGTMLVPIPEILPSVPVSPRGANERH